MNKKGQSIIFIISIIIAIVIVGVILFGFTLAPVFQSGHTAFYSVKTQASFTNKGATFNENVVNDNPDLNKAVIESNTWLKKSMSIGIVLIGLAILIGAIALLIRSLKRK